MYAVTQQIGLRPTHNVPSEDIGLVPSFLTINGSPAERCQMVIAQLFSSPKVVWALLDEVDKIGFRDHVDWCEKRGWHSVDRQYLDEFYDGTRLGAETCFATFALIREAYPTLYASPQPVELEHKPDFRLANKVPYRSTNGDFNRITNGVKHSYSPALKQAGRDGMWAGINAGIIMLAARHDELAASFEPSESTLSELEMSEPIEVLYDLS